MSEIVAEPGMSREEAAAVGMGLAWHAAQKPDHLAIVSQVGDRTFSELNENANRLVRALRSRGVHAGDAVALLCSNRPEFAETIMACLRGGYRITPINWHLKGEEVGYIVDNCEARAFIADARFPVSAAEAADMAPALLAKLAIGGGIAGFEGYSDALEAEDGANLTDPVLGSQMMYTSGTTGRPKGVYRPRPPGPAPLVLKMQETANFQSDDIALVTGPLYHAAPLALNLNFPLAAGVGCVLMDKWDAEETLRLIDEYKVTHTHLVPTMMHRMLQLPAEVKADYDLSSLRWILHGAAPCPVHVKEEMIRWLGPIVFEYYAATEGGGIFADSHEWLAHKGTVGKPLDGVEVSVQDEDGKEVGPGEMGTIYFKAPEVGRFEYFKAPDKTESAYRGDHYTMGDMGYVDEDGFLFLTGRSAEVIISGGVNIYPAEIDQEVLKHPAVRDVAAVGVPNEDWGEEVKLVVELNDGYAADEKTAAELLGFAGEHLAGYKRPRSVDFIDELPRMPSGKVLRRTIRDSYWGDKKI